MSDINRKLNEYKEKFQIIATQAEADGRGYIKRLVETLLNNYHADLQLYDFIFLSVDDMTQEIADMYVKLMEKNAELEWYNLISSINDEYSNPQEYYPVIIECKDKNIDIQKVHNALGKAMLPDDLFKLFQTGSREKEDSGYTDVPGHSGEVERFIEHLKAENNRLNARLDLSLKELAEAQQGVKAAMEEAFANHKVAIQYKFEAEQLKKKEMSSNLAVKLAEGKSQKAREMLVQYENIVAQLRRENDCLKRELSDKELLISEMSAEIDALKQMDMATTDLVSDNVPIEPSDVDVFPEEDFIDAFMTPIEEEEKVEEEVDYSKDDLISITDNREEIVKHTNLLGMLITKYQEKKFKRKTVSEQESMIFAKMMEQKFSKSKLLMIKKALKENSTLSRFELYRLISRDASDDELNQFCGDVATT